MIVGVAPAWEAVVLTKDSFFLDIIYTILLG